VASGLRERVLTALPIAAVIIGVLLYLPPAVAVGLVAVVFLAGAWEWAGFAGLSSRGGRALYLLVIAAGMAVGWRLSADPRLLAGGLRLALAWWGLALAWLVLAPQRGGRAAAAAAGLLVLVPAAVSLARLVMLEPVGRELLLYLIILIAAADIGAYFGGRSLGKHKLAPRVSPGKTWEGFVAGMLAATAAGVAGAFLFQAPLGTWVGCCVLAAFLSVVGDLCESMFKRRAGLKDSGSLLPGHGGILDRIDSFTAAGPAFLLGLRALGFGA